MAYIRHKVIRGHRYYYLVRSVRTGKTVRQIHMRYIGKNKTGPGMKPDEERNDDAAQLLKDLQAGKYGKRMTKEDYEVGGVRPETYYHVVRADRSTDFLKHGIEGRREVDGKRHVYLWNNLQSAQRYREMLKEDFPNVSHDILEVRVPKRDPMEPWGTYGIPGAKSVDTEKIDARFVRKVPDSEAHAPVFYHVTKEKDLARIERDGLKAKPSRWWKGRRVFLWDSKEHADYYASWVRGGDKATGRERNVVLEVRAPVKDITTPNQWDDPHIKASKKSIPPENIRQVERGPAPKTMKSTIIIPKPSYVGPRRRATRCESV